MQSSNSISKSLGWKLLERFGVSGGQFVLQIVLARLLSPEHYGVLSLMIVFTTLANVFIQNGLNTALIQNKDVKEEDYSSVFWVLVAMVVFFYTIIFVSAPFIGEFYKMPDIVNPLRVLALMLFPGALNAVQLAKISREMDFKKVFYSNVAAIVVSGVVSICIAYMGGGLWALVAQSVLNVLVACIVMRFTVKLRLIFKVNISRIKVLFSFGWKLMVSSLIDTLYADLRSLVIGKKYNSETLGYYNRGKQFPHFIINAVNGAVQSVMLPAMSHEQDDTVRLKELTRNSITMSAYIIFPILAGLAGTATTLVKLLLTDKWLPCVPYMQIYCLSLAFYPVHTCNLQAINAVGRSDVYLKLEIIKKIIGVTSLVCAVIFFDTPIAIALTGVISTGVNCFVNAFPNKKFIGYSYFEQMKDIFPSFLLSLAMLGIILAVEKIITGLWLTLFVQVIIGVAVYFVMSFIAKIKPFEMILFMSKKVLKKQK